MSKTAKKEFVTKLQKRLDIKNVNAVPKVKELKLASLMNDTSSSSISLTTRDVASTIVL